MTKLNNTNRQHHVAQFYLRGWATNNRIFCLREGRIIKTNVKDSAVQNRFYELRPLSERDEAFIRHWISKLPQSSHELHEQTLKMFTLPFKLKRGLTPALAQNTALVDRIDHTIINLEEHYHGQLEAINAPIVESMRSGSLSFYDDDDKCGHFLHFLMLQLFRTKAVRDKFMDRARATGTEDEFANCWNVLTHIWAATVGGTLYVERSVRRPVLLRNRTGLGFVTSDQPTFNLCSANDHTTARYAPFYPLSPTLAFMLTDTDGHYHYKSDTLTRTDVLELNRRMAATSSQQIFSHSEGPLRLLQAQAT